MNESLELGNTIKSPAVMLARPGHSVCQKRNARSKEIKIHPYVSTNSRRKTKPPWYSNSWIMMCKARNQQHTWYPGEHTVLSELASAQQTEIKQVIKLKTWEICLSIHEHTSFSISFRVLSSAVPNSYVTKITIRKQESPNQRKPLQT